MGNPHENVLRLKDIAKGGARLAPPREVERASWRLSDLVRRGGKPAFRGQGSVPLEKGPLAGPALPLKKAPQKPPSAGGEAEGDRETADRVFQRAVNTLEAILQAVRAGEPFSLVPAEEAVEALLQNLMAGDTLLVPFFSRESLAPSLAQEMVNVGIISLKMGLELGHTTEELRRLGLVALLHDIGMARLPEALLAKQDLFGPEERTALERHPEEGARLLRGLGPQYHWLAEVVLQVHERLDGSGYPKGLKGREIHDHAYIVGLADVYESLLHPRPFRRRLGPVEALKEILQRERSAFPDRLLKALIRALSIFPVGSLVRLNTGEIGRVMAKNKDLPLRPVVEILTHRDKRLEEPVIIDLSQSPLLYIQDSVVEEALPPLTDSG